MRVTISQNKETPNRSKHMLAGKHVEVVRENEDIITVRLDDWIVDMGINDVVSVEVTDTDVWKAFEGLKRAIKNLLYHTREHLDAKTEFERAFQTSIADGFIDGKNEDSRLGVFRNNYPEVISVYELRKSQLASAEIEVELARIHLEEMQTLYQMKVISDSL